MYSKTLGSIAFTVGIYVGRLIGIFEPVGVLTGQTLGNESTSRYVDWATTWECSYL